MTTSIHYNSINIVALKSDKNPQGALILDKNNDGVISFEDEFLPVIRQALGQFNRDADHKETITNGQYFFSTGKDEKINFDRIAVKQGGMPSAESLNAIETDDGRKLVEFQIPNYARELYDWLAIGKWGSGWRPEFIDNPDKRLTVAKLQAYFTHHVQPNNKTWFRMF